MFSLFIMLFVIIGVVSTVGFAILSLIRTGENSLMVQKNQARVDVLAQTISASLEHKNGHVLIPVDMDGSAVSSTLPPVVQFKKTAYGVDITYCPVAGLDLTDAVDGIGPLVLAGPYKVYKTANRDFVVAGSGNLKEEVVAKIRADNVVALMLIPGPQTNHALDCAEVELSDDNLIAMINGGSVTPIFATPNGMRTVFNVSDNANLELALNKIAYEKPASATIRLGSNLTADFPVLNDTLSGLNGRSMLIESDGTPRQLAVSNSTGPIEVTGKLELREVSIPASITASILSDVYVNGAMTGPISVRGGRLILGDDSIIEAPLSVDGGDVRIEIATIDASSASTAINLRGGRIHFAGEPVIPATGSTSILSVSGNGSVTGTSNTITAQVNRGMGYAQETIYRSEPVKVSGSCVGTQCEVTCSSSTKVVTGYCQSTEALLTGYRISDDRTTLTCSWQDPVISSQAVAFCQ